MQYRAKVFNPLKNHQMNLDYKWRMTIIPASIIITHQDALKLNLQNQNSLFVSRPLK